MLGCSSWGDVAPLSGVLGARGVSWRADPELHSVPPGLCLPGRECGRLYSRGHCQRRWALRAGQIATAYGTLPTVMGADTAPVAVVITDTVLSKSLVT